MEKSINVEFLGNYYGKSQNFDGSVFSKGGCSPTLVASMAHGCAPKVIEVFKRGKEGKWQKIT